MENIQHMSNNTGTYVDSRQPIFAPATAAVASKQNLPPGWEMPFLSEIYEMHDDLLQKLTFLLTEEMNRESNLKVGQYFDRAIPTNIPEEKLASLRRLFYDAARKAIEERVIKATNNRLMGARLSFFTAGDKGEGITGQTIPINKSHKSIPSSYAIINVNQPVLVVVPAGDNVQGIPPGWEKPPLGEVYALHSTILQKLLMLLVGAVNCKPRRRIGYYFDQTIPNNISKEKLQSLKNLFYDAGKKGFAEKRIGAGNNNLHSLLYVID